MRRAVIIFTRVPLPGQTKTRMMPYLSANQCARLHTCFLLDLAVQCTQVQADLFVCYTPEEGKRLRSIFGEEAVYFPQTGEGLGERMHEAIMHVLGAGYEACVLIGTDVPELQSKDIAHAFRVLSVEDVVFGPTVDGGYYLVGMKSDIRTVFEHQTYGHGSVLENTVENLEKSGYSAGYVRKLHDMDTKENLQDFCKRMRENHMLQRTYTGSYVVRNRRISIIVPIYNEETTIQKLQKQLIPLLGHCEIIFVDGGSTDQTVSLIAPEFRILHSAKGRANQMNLGARESRGDILFFLHSDSELPAKPLEEIRAVMKDYRAGCFGIAFRSRHFFLWTCRVISNHRIKDRKVMFGDQGIFIERELFFEAGMFPDLPIMEDYQFSLILKEMGVRLGIAKHRIYTSARRFPKGTIPKLRVMWKMNRLRKMYRDGMPIQRIADMYRDVR